MGSGVIEASGRSLIDDPSLNLQTYKYRYKESVREWMSRVKVFANGGDTRAKGIASGFGHFLFAAMEKPYQKIVKAALRRKTLPLEPEELVDTPSYADQKKLVESILATVAKDLYADLTTREIAFGRRMFNCKRAKGEAYAPFADRSNGIAQEYINCLGHMPIEQEKQNAALIF